MLKASSETLADSIFRVLPVRSRVETMSERGGEDFGRVLLECVDRTLEDLMGPKVRDAAYLVLEKNYIPRGDIPQRPDQFGSFLEQTFGVAGKTIGRAIARCLYSRLSLNFMDNPDYGFREYIRAAKP